MLPQDSGNHESDGGETNEGFIGTAMLQNSKVETPPRQSHDDGFVDDVIYARRNGLWHVVEPRFRKATELTATLVHLRHKSSEKRNRGEDASRRVASKLSDDQAESPTRPDMLHKHQRTIE